jgi:hypothetical protein
LLYAVVLVVPLLGWAGISDFGAREIALGIVLPAIWPQGASYDEPLLGTQAYAAFVLLALVVLHIGLAVPDSLTAKQLQRNSVRRAGPSAVKGGPVPPSNAHSSFEMWAQSFRFPESLAATAPLRGPSETLC